MTTGNESATQETNSDTLFGVAGRKFEKNVLWLTLHDQDFAQQTAGHLTSDQFDYIPYQTIVSTYRDINDKHGGKHVATLDSVHTDLTARYNKAREGSPTKEALGAALKSCRILGKRTKILTADREFIIEKVRDFIVTRNLREAVYRAAECLSSGKGIDTIPDLINTAALTGSLRPSIGIKYAHVKKRIRMYGEEEKVRRRSPTDIPMIDETLLGGLPSKMLGVFVAPQGRGKTMAMIHVGAAALLRGLTVVHCTLEIPDVVVARRYDGRLTGIPINELSQKLERYKRVLIKSAHKLSGKLYIKEWGSNEASTLDIRAYLKNLEKYEGVTPDVIMVDYAELLRPTRIRKEVRFELGDIARELRQIAKDYDCAVWTASQITKEGQRSDIPEMHHSRETSVLMDVADYVCGFGQTLQEKRRERLRWANLKNRIGGRVGRVVDCIVKEETQLFSQAAHQSQALETINDSRRKKRSHDE